MKSLTQFIEGMTDSAYVKNPKAFAEIEKETKTYAKNIVANMEHSVKNDEQKSDYLYGVLRNLWAHMTEGTRKIFLSTLKEFIDQ